MGRGALSLGCSFFSFFGAGLLFLGQLEAFRTLIGGTAVVAWLSSYQLASALGFGIANPLGIFEVGSIRGFPLLALPCSSKGKLPLLPPHPSS